MRATLFYAISLICVAASPLHAGMRSLTRAASVESFRPVGEIRYWNFVSRDSNVGYLVSTVEQGEVADGKPTTIFSEKLKYDYRKVGSSLTMDASGKHRVAAEGSYLGDQITLGLTNRREQFELARSGDRLVGYFTREGQRVEQSLPCPVSRFAWDNMYVDQLELYFAMHDLTVGAVIQDSVFAPLPMITSPFRAEIVDFDKVHLYNDKYDSAFVIQITQPQGIRVYFTPDKRLVKVDMVDAGTKAYLDAVTRKPSAGSLRSASASISTRILMIVFTMMLTFVVLLFFGWRGFKSPISVWSAAAGGFGFWITPFTLIPLQMWLVKSWLIPSVNAGGSLYLLSLVPSVASGTIQEILKLIFAAGVTRIRTLKAPEWAYFGAFIGASFGFFEASYLGSTGTMPGLLALDVLGQVCFILFHASSGLLLGLALASGKKQLLVTLGCTIAMNTAFRYLPVFVQQKAATVTFMYLVMCFLAVVSVLAAILVRKRQLG